MRPGVRVKNGDITPSSTNPFALPEPLYLCADVFDATVTPIDTVEPCGALIELNDFRVGTVRSVVFKVVRVDTPAEFIFATVIFGVPVNPCELTASVAVFASVAVVAVPVTSPVTLPVRSPLKVDAVIIPVALICPKELIPTPSCCGLEFTLPPICNPLLGSSV